MYGRPPVYGFCLDSAALLMMNEQQFYLFGQIQNSRMGGQSYSDTFTYGNCSQIKRTESLTGGVLGNNCGKTVMGGLGRHVPTYLPIGN